MSRELNRRKFLFQSGVMLGSMLPLSAYAPLFDISAIPNFCTHEHWGSIEAIGQAPEQEGFLCDTTAGAQPKYPVSVWDLFLDPYEEGWLKAGAHDPEEEAQRHGYPHFSDWWKQSPAKALKAFQTQVQSSLMTGGFQCTRRGIKFQYGIDLENFSLQDWISVDKMIATNYSHVFDWYKQGMKRAHFTELIRPVHPEFYVNQESAESSKKEFSFTHTVMRIDPLIDLWKEKSPRREALAKIAGVDPADADSWRRFITGLFDIAAKNGSLGIKQLQAYKRSLDFIPRQDAEVRFRGDLDKQQTLVFQDWVMHECCKQAHERNWIHQVHVGTHNLPASNPLPLKQLAERYPGMQLVMIHCWPFLQEAAFLSKLVPNIYVDTCWLPVLNPAFLQQAFHLWLNYVPAHKIMLGHDSTHIEMATGSSLFTREILAASLLDQKKNLKMSDTSLTELARDMLQNNAVRLYKIGSEC